MNEGRWNKRNRTWGLILILVGVSALLVQLGALPADLAQLWPILVIGLGLWMLVRSLTDPARRGFTAGVVALAAGGYFAAAKFWGADEELFFPLLIMAIGLALLLRPSREQQAP